MDDFTQQGIAALKAGDKTEARHLLTQAVRQDKQNVLAWYALSFAMDKEKDQVFCLQQVNNLILLNHSTRGSVSIHHTSPQYLQKVHLSFRELRFQRNCHQFQGIF